MSYRTLVDAPRLEVLKWRAFSTSHLDGMNAEVGVYKGGTAKLIAEAIPEKHLMLFDTFEGMPEVSEFDKHQKGDFGDTSLESVQEYLKEHKNISYYKGTFPDSLPGHAFYSHYSFVHLDVDIYKSVDVGLRFFWPRMIKDGIIVLDDVLEPNCPGAYKAFMEFCENKDVKIISISQSQVVIRK